MLNIATTYAASGSGYVVPSAAAKAGVVAMTKSLAAEWGKYGIRLNAIAPGPFPTEGAWSRLLPTPEIQAMFEKQIPLRRVGEHLELGKPGELPHLGRGSVYHRRSDPYRRRRDGLERRRVQRFGRGDAGGVGRVGGCPQKKVTFHR